MDLKKQMEKDLEEAQKKLLVLDTGYDMENPNYFECWEISSQIEIIKKYLKAFENDMVIEVGKRYNVKRGLKQYIKCKEIETDKYLYIYLDAGDIIKIDEIDNNHISFYDYRYDIWTIDIETFKHMFEGVKNG